MTIQVFARYSALRMLCTAVGMHHTFLQELLLVKLEIRLLYAYRYNDKDYVL